MLLSHWAYKIPLIEETRKRDQESYRGRFNQSRSPNDCLLSPPRGCEGVERDGEGGGVATLPAGTISTNQALTDVTTDTIHGFKC